MTVVKSIEEALDVLSKNIIHLGKSNFNPLGAYVYPLQSDVPLEVNLESWGITPLTGEEGVIIDLCLRDEWQLFQMLEPKYGPLEHGILERQLQSCYHDDQRYKNNVLVPFMVKTGEMGIKKIWDHGVYKIKGIVPRKVPKPPIVFDDKISKSGIMPNDYTYVLERESGVFIPTRGYFSRIGNMEGKGFWNGTSIDSEGRFTAMCGYYSDKNGLMAEAHAPSYRGNHSVLGAWRKID